MIETSGILILSQDEKILILKPSGVFSSSPWSIPKGHIEMGEDPIDAATRETKEEAGIAFDGNDLIPMGERVFSNKKKKLHVFLAKIQKESKDINPKLNWEHSEYLWVSPKEGRDLVHEAQKPFFDFAAELIL